MFEIVGVIRPNPDIADLESLASSYEGVEKSATSAQEIWSDGIKKVLNANDGEVAELFASKTSGVSSVQNKLTELAEAAARTAIAYSAAAQEASECATSADVMAAEYAVAFQKALLQLDQRAISLILYLAREDLTSIIRQGTSQIRNIFDSLDLPEKATIPTDDSRGNLDEKIKEDFDELSKNDPEKAKEILQRIADEYADEHGLPRIAVGWKPIQGAYGLYSHSERKVYLSSDYLSSGNGSDLLTTVVHEMEHARQFSAADDWRNPITRIPKIFVGFNGYESAEAQRYAESIDNEYIRHKGDDPNTSEDESYYPRPIEVGAREAGRDFVNRLSYEEYLRYK